MTRLLPFALVAALVLNPALSSACDQPTPPRFDGGFEGDVSVSVGRIAGLIWVPLVIDGIAVPEGSDLWLKVAFDGKVEGGTGCNRFTGTADLDAGVMAFSPLAVTEMACPEPDRMAREVAYLKALSEVRWFIASSKELWLSREDGSVAVCF